MSKTIIIAVVLIVAFVAIKTIYSRRAAAENIQLGETFLAQNGLKDTISSTASGLQYEVITKGTGTVHPKATDKVTVHYHGTLLDGTVFDSSVDRGTPLTFSLNQVIPGWTEGVQLMVEGEKTRFFIPSHLGYGNNGAGPIPAGALLIFEVELLAIGGF